jgi:crossover junction endodeoxyribonuclease RuvC
MGIDPGLRLTGYACIEIHDPSAARDASYTSAASPGEGIQIIEAGIFRLSSTRSISERLLELDTDLCEVIQRLRPALVAVEKLYSHYKHPTTAAIMGHARGVVLLGIKRAGIQLVELGATEVKKSLTGHGHASKSQMQHAVAAQLGLVAMPEPPDVADAIAIALCAGRRRTRSL